MSDNSQDIKLTPYQENGIKIISQVIDVENTVTLNVVNNSEEVMIGDVNTSTIDIGDILALGDECIVNAGTSLMHETKEQFDIQIKKISVINAHRNAVGLENSMMNAQISVIRECFGFGDRPEKIMFIESLYNGEKYKTKVHFLHNNVTNIVQFKF